MISLTRLLSLAILSVGIGLSLPATAQQENDLIEVIRGQIKKDRQAVVAANMTLSATQSENFWPLYREYHQERDGLIDRRIALLTDFRDNRMGMTADQASQILKDALKLENDIGKLKRKYASKFEKVLSPRATLRYYQIENKLDTIIDYELASVVPLRQ
jgi:pyruvate formate-lyase activating enzyme-like uncharacterized protein